MEQFEGNSAARLTTSNTVPTMTMLKRNNKYDKSQVITLSSSSATNLRSPVAKSRNYTISETLTPNDPEEKAQKNVRNLHSHEENHNARRRNSHATHHRHLTSPSPNLVIRYLTSLKNQLFNWNVANLFMFMVISIITNSIYYNFYYPRDVLRKIGTADGGLKIESDAHKANSMPSLNSLITWSSSYIYYKSQEFAIKSYEHVTFPPMDDDGKSHAKDDHQKNIQYITQIEEEILEKKSIWFLHSQDTIRKKNVVVVFFLLS